MFKDRIAEIDLIKSEIDKYRPLPPYCLPMLKEYFRIGLTYTSNAIEGNTLTETETKVIIEDGLTIGGKTFKEHCEVIGHSEAYNFMWKKGQSNSFSEADILELHRLFYYRIDQQKAGKYRDVPVIVTGTDFEFPKPQDLSFLMREFCENILNIRQKYHSVHFAALLHVTLVTIHPFVDGNGRTARLLMNLALLQDGYPITIIPPIMRNSYISAIRQANKGTTTPFLDFISEMVYESSKDYLRLIKSCT